jgi:hypothetical protein
MPIDGHQSFFDADHATGDGIIMLVLGVMFLMATFKGDNKRISLVWLWIRTAAGFALAAILIIQGCLVLTCR